jgi:hypothetical protein
MPWRQFGQAAKITRIATTEGTCTIDAMSRRPFLPRALMVCALTGALLAGVLSVACAQATTFVPNRFDDPSSGGNDCTPPAPANGCSLRGALAAAQNGDTIELPAGTYTLTLGQLEISHAITIAGAGAQSTIIEQTGHARVLFAEDELTVSGVTITGGDLVGAEGTAGGQGEQETGAGIGGDINVLKLTNVVVSGNRATAGNGGAGTPGSGATKGGIGGRGGFAGGAGISGAGVVELTNVAVTGNVAQAGAGGDGGDGGTTGGGGQGGASGDASGAGIDLGLDTTLTATDTLIAGNQALGASAGAGGAGGSSGGAGAEGGQGEPSDGGGLFSNGKVTFTNVTIADNTAGGAPGGTGGNARGGTTAGGAGGIGFGGAGGGLALFNGAEGTFASVTIAGNISSVAEGGPGGNGFGGGAAGKAGTTFPTDGGDVLLSSATLAISDTIIATGQGSAGTENCAFGGIGALTSDGHNLDDTSQCIATPQASDIIDEPAGLAALANNGGPTETMGLQSGSAAIRAGASPCLDANDHALTSDQRGEPRGTPCDIGAFEGQAPKLTSPPTITGVPDVGSTLACALGTLTGDQPQTRSVEWLLEGASVSGATNETYTVPAGDVGHMLSCREAVTNPFGSAAATSAAVIALGRVPIFIDDMLPPLPSLFITLSPRKVRDKHKEKVVVTLTGFGPNGAGSLRFSLRRKRAGVKVHGRCLARSVKHEHGRGCTRLSPVTGAPAGATVKADKATLTWTPRHLAPGTYVLVATLKSNTFSTIVGRLTFTVIR